MKKYNAICNDGATIEVILDHEMSFKKGDQVIITDPCYWFDNSDAWSKFINLMWHNDKGEKEVQPIFKYGKVTYKDKNGKVTKFLYSSTAHGDGCYGVITHNMYTAYNNKNMHFFVDAGMYAISLLDDAKDLAPERNKDRLDVDMGCALTCMTDISVEVDGKNMGGDINVITG